MSATPVGEVNWIEHVDQGLRDGGHSLDNRVTLIEQYRRAVAAEPGSLKVWVAYCEFFWKLYDDCHAGKVIGWTADEVQIGCEAFSLDAALSLWQEGYEAVQYRVSDSHELWNRWVSHEMELLCRTRTEQGVRRITHLFKDRLSVPHSTWDQTSQMFSSFLSEYNRSAYETEMEEITKNAAEAKHLYRIRDNWETKLSVAEKAGDELALKQIMSDYLGWEIRTSKGERYGLVNFKICLGLFARALTGIFSEDDTTWLNLIVFVSSMHADLKTGQCKTPDVAKVLPKLLDVHQRAARHIPWNGPVWARYILCAEEAGLPFHDIERIKHAATSSTKLDQDGMTGVLEMYSAWCGYLKRTAMNPNASEEAIDLADVGLPAALEDVRHWGKRRYGDGYQGDPAFRLEKIWIQFLFEKKDDVEGARDVWQQLSKVSIHANSYDFWLNWYLWEMVVFAKSNNRSPTPAGMSQGLRVPTKATQVFYQALLVKDMDWPERVMGIFNQHCNDYELPETIRHAQDTLFKTGKALTRRRQREAEQQAQNQAEAINAQARVFGELLVDETATSAATLEGGEGAETLAGKRKRDSVTEDNAANKRLRSSQANGANPKRDREHRSVFVSNLPADITATKLKKFFREYGHVDHIELNTPKGQPPIAYIEFKSDEDVSTALIRDGKKIEDCVVNVTSAAGCTLYVTNYPPEADDEFIRKMFKKFGQIHGIRFPSTKYNLRRRFCYVTFSDHESASAALKIDGKLVGDKKYKLSVDISDPDHRKQREGALAEQRELRVLNISSAVKDNELEDIFAKHGSVESVRILRNENSFGPGSAFVIMKTRKMAQEAIKKVDKLVYQNRILTVELAKRVFKRDPNAREDKAASATPDLQTAETDGDHKKDIKMKAAATTFKPLQTITNRIRFFGKRGGRGGARGGGFAISVSRPTSDLPSTNDEGSAFVATKPAKSNNDFKKLVAGGK